MGGNESKERSTGRRASRKEWREGGRKKGLDEDRLRESEGGREEQESRREHEGGRELGRFGGNGDRGSEGVRLSEMMTNINISTSWISGRARERGGRLSPQQ